MRLGLHAHLLGLGGGTVGKSVPLTRGGSGVRIPAATDKSPKLEVTAPLPNALQWVCSQGSSEKMVLNNLFCSDLDVIP